MNYDLINTLMDKAAKKAWEKTSTKFSVPEGKDLTEEEQLYYNEWYDKYYDKLYQKNILKIEGVQVGFKLAEGVELPAYQTEGSAGFDVCANPSEFHLFAIDDWRINLHTGEHKLIKTGLFPQIPEGYELQVRPRSGLAYKHMITVLNSPGTIDSDFKSEIGVILVNHSAFNYIIKKGDRIAQLVLSKVPKANIYEIKEEDYKVDTDRGEGGFGSTDKTEKTDGK